MSVQHIGLLGTIAFRFGPFELNVAERSLKKASQVVPLGGRAYDILIALLDNAGDVVARADLIAKAWPDVTVEEGSLRVHLSALRKALGDGQFGDKYIANVQGRGYSFIAPVTRLRVKGGCRASAIASNLPPALERMVGRDNFVREIVGWLKTGRRPITIVGAGGIGKTTVALAVGHAAVPDFFGAVFFIDLSAVSDKAHVIDVVASTLGVIEFTDRRDALLKILHSRRALVIFDSCEHLKEMIAEFVESILRSAPDVRVLLTSRDILQIAGDCVLHLPPLVCPPARSDLAVSGLLSYPATRLFVDRISARRGDVTFSDDEASIVADICRKLDGVALAIELAAGRAANFGVKNTAANLESGLDFLKWGRRTANPRHQTFKASLDWSHDHLSEIERIVLRRVAIFIGRFTMEAANAVGTSGKVGQSEISGAIQSLTNKSLIAVRTSSRGLLYRLMNTTRCYALEKLDLSGERDSIAARHASFSVQLLESKRGNLFCRQTAETPGALRDYLGDIRAALEWSFGSPGNDDTAIRTAAAAASLLLAMSHFVECRGWMERALDRIAAESDPRDQMQIYASLAVSLMFTAGNSERVRDAFSAALRLAETLGDTDQQLRLLSGLSMYLHRTVEAASGLEVALRAESIAQRTGSPEDRALADSMLGTAYHMLGDQVRGPRHLERALRRSTSSRRSDPTRYVFDLRTTLLFDLTQSLWFAGNLDRAGHYAESAIDEAEKSHHPIAMCRALILTMPFYYWIDDLERVARNLAVLDLIAQKYSLEPYRAVAQGLKGRYLIRVDQTMAGICRLKGSLEKLRMLRYEPLVTDFECDLAVSLAKRNQREEGLALIEGSIAAQFQSKTPLHLPALLLAKGLAFVSGKPQHDNQAEECFEEAMTIAGQQSALSFELRAGLELARLWIDRGQAQKAHNLIGPIYGRFTEGLATPDLILARQILEQTSVRTRQAGLRATKS